MDVDHPKHVFKIVCFYLKVISCLLLVRNFNILFIFVSCEEKDCYRVVLVGQLGLTAARTAGTPTVVLSKSLFCNSFLILSREV